MLSELSLGGLEDAPEPKPKTEIYFLNKTGNDDDDDDNDDDIIGVIVADVTDVAEKNNRR